MLELALEKRDVDLDLMKHSVPPKKLSKTKQRILDAAVSAFNEQSFDAVTTASLAERLEMSEGNLWYHYKTKADLLAAIQARFIEDWRSAFSGPIVTGDIVQDYARFFRSWMEIVDRYSFVFRDRAEYGAHSPEFANALPDIYGSLRAQLRDLLVTIHKAGGLSMSEDSIDDLVLNIIITSRFYLEFQKESGMNLPVSPTAVTSHHMTLLKPVMDQRLYSFLADALR